MYHASDAHIITTDDITGAKSLKLHERKGRKYLSAEVELNPDKEYTEEGLRLHLTNGVTHRYLMPVEDAPEEEAAEKKDEAASELDKAKGAVEGTSVPLYTTRKQSDTKKG